MPRVTYSGHAPRGTVHLATRSLPFVRLAPLEVTDDEAALLGDEWAPVKSPKPKTPPTEGTTTKEPSNG